MYRRKGLSFLLALILCGQVLSGCGNTGKSAGGDEGDVAVQESAAPDVSVAESADGTYQPVESVESKDAEAAEVRTEAGERQENAVREGNNNATDDSKAANATSETGVNASDGQSPDVLAPSVVLKLTAGSILMEKSIDWNEIDNYFATYEIVEGDAVYSRIIGKSYHPNDDIGLESLCYLKLLHYNFEGNLQVGELICNVAIAQDLVDIFKELFYRKYEICSMHLIDDYWTGDGIESDEASIEVDNTSCFCYRKATDADNLSNHALGRAIDLNPRENPFYLIREDGSLEYYHTNAEPYLLNRDPSLPHVITHEDEAYRAFAAHGFSWGGDWANPKDYQHFEKLS